MTSEKTEMRWQIASNIATTFASIVAIVALIIGYFQFVETQRATRETLDLQRRALQEEHNSLNIQRETLGQELQSKAVDLFIEYNKLMKELSSNQKLNNDENFWQNNLAVGILERIFLLTKNDNEWKKGIKQLLLNHTEFLKKNYKEICPTYNPEFRPLISEIIGKDLCES